MTLTVDEVTEMPDGWLNEAVGGFLTQNEHGKYRLTSEGGAGIPISFKDRTPSQFVDRDITVAPIRGEGGSIKKDVYNGFPYIRVGPKATIAGGMGDLGMGDLDMEPPAHKAQEAPQKPRGGNVQSYKDVVSGKALFGTPQGKHPTTQAEAEYQCRQLRDMYDYLAACFKDLELPDEQRQSGVACCFIAADKRDVWKGFEPDAKPDKPQDTEPISTDDDVPF